MSPRLVPLCFIALLCAACTAPNMMLDTARAPGAGGITTTIGGEVAGAVEDVSIYGMVDQDEVPEDTSVESPYPFWPVHAALLVRGALGLGAGFELQGQLHLSGLAGGAGLGLKWQFVGAGSDGPVALALITRGGYHVASCLRFIDADDVFHQLFGEGIVAATFQLGGRFELSLLPRVRYDWVTEQDCSEQDQPTWRNCTADVLWSGGALGFGWKRGGNATHLFEVGALVALPTGDGETSASWLPTFAYGARFDLVPGGSAW